MVAEQWPGLPVTRVWESAGGWQHSSAITARRGSCGEILDSLTWFSGLPGCALAMRRGTHSGRKDPCSVPLDMIYCSRLPGALHLVVHSISPFALGGLIVAAVYWFKADRLEPHITIDSSECGQSIGTRAINFMCGQSDRSFLRLRLSFVPSVVNEGIGGHLADWRSFLEFFAISVYCTVPTGDGPSYCPIVHNVANEKAFN